ncbi:MAG: aldo/keto reductase [Prolixibacteraceae bacterium]|nr:aldo/keto reductase [Prolixibacteraceae bacterium]
MVYNRVGNSGLKLPAISAGLWQHFGDTDAFAKCKDIICKAFDLGITHFDLANNYGTPAGSSEEIFGRVLNNELKNYRDEIIITTKAGYDMWPGPYGEWGSKKYMVASMDQSLKRLGVDYIDVFYSHRFDPETPLEETMGALDLMVRQGKALYVGISNYDLENTKKAVGILKDLGTPCLIHQPSYSMFNRWIEDGLKDFINDSGIGLITFQPMQRGLITNAFLDGIPTERAESLAEIGITEPRVAKARKLNEIAIKRGQSLAQMAVAWVLRDNKVASVLVGADKIEHIEDNVKALENTNFTEEELMTIDTILVN